MVPPTLVKPFGDIDDQKIFADGRVKHYGEAICAIIATTEAAAEHAASKVIVEYEPLPVYLNAEASKHPDAIQFDARKPGNLAFQLPELMFPNNIMGHGDVEAGFAEADLIIEDTLYTNKQKQCQMEPNSYIALYDDDEKLTCWTSTQMPKCVQSKLATIFEVPVSRMKLVQTTVGGGFGARLGMVLEPQVCALAMAMPGHPIKIQSPREEDWLTSPSRHPGDWKVKLGFKKDGTPVAAQANFASYKGAYYLDGSGVAATTGGWLQAVYKWQNLAYKGETYFTNQPVCGAYRGYGNPQQTFVMESMIDRALEQLDIDPVEWRMKWHKQVGDGSWFPDVPYSSVAIDPCLEKGAQAIGWKEKREKYKNQSGTVRRGVGVGVTTHTSGAFPMLLEHTVCSIKLNEDASANLTFACSDLGQGSHTALRQIAAEALDFPIDDISLNTQDGDITGFDIGAHASRTLYVGGGAVMEAVNDAKRQVFERAARLLEANADDLELKDKQVFVKGSPSKSVSLKEMLGASVFNFDVSLETGPSFKEGQIEGYSSYNPPHCSPPWAATFIEVEVDMETGEYELIEMVNTHDIGRAINPAIVEGQMEGGAQQGLGMALSEELYFSEDGKVLNNGFTDYKMLGPSDMPKMTNIIIEEPDPFGPFGAKSVGETGLCTPVGAVANAIYHATGVSVTDLPITPEKVLKAIKAQEAA
jgi:xanthine dehydrogenase molybdenum-binding subunit